ncbi:hypothetical protein QM306_39075, partial [Burkholderia cenocepacia]|nr:hypothetical protein [Burkholderia cenocepacia]
EARIRAEAEEETGYRVRGVRKVFEAFMSPGSVTEKLHFFVGEYDASLRTRSRVAAIAASGSTKDGAHGNVQIRAISRIFVQSRC